MAGAYKYWFNGHGETTVDCYLGADGVNSQSIVVASITELVRGGRTPTFTGEIWPAHMGAAPMSVLNVTPADGGRVSVRVRIEWDEPLDFQVSLIVG